MGADLLTPNGQLYFARKSFVGVRGRRIAKEGNKKVVGTIGTLAVVHHRGDLWRRVQLVRTRTVWCTLPETHKSVKLSIISSCPMVSTFGHVHCPLG